MANKYTYSAPYSEEELFNLYVNKELSQIEIATIYGISQHKVLKDLRRMKIPARKAIKRNQLGENNHMWKGGKVLVHHKAAHRFLSTRNNNKGYIMIKNRNHANANKQGYVYEHVLVALNYAGRNCLDRQKECVHHINFIRTDNRPENLCICTKDKHQEYHGKLESLVGELLDKGIVGFSLDKGYFIK